jgi:hypothetical protein
VWSWSKEEGSGMRSSEGSWSKKEGSGMRSSEGSWSGGGAGQRRADLVGEGAGCGGEDGRGRSWLLRGGAGRGRAELRGGGRSGLVGGGAGWSFVLRRRERVEGGKALIVRRRGGRMGRRKGFAIVSASPFFFPFSDR